MRSSEVCISVRILGAVALHFSAILSIYHTIEIFSDIP